MSVTSLKNALITFLRRASSSKCTMARFNLPTRKRDRVENLAGGEAHAVSPQLELVSILATSFLSDQYYRRTEDTLARIRELIDRVDPLFAAKAAVYARTHFHTRSITHVMAGELCLRVKGEPWTRGFLERVVERPDDMLEIVAYYQGLTGARRPIPNAMKKGLAAAFDKFDGYQLAKYRGGSKSVSLVDVVNLVHPKPTAENGGALAALVADTLRSTETWESMLTRAGQEAEDESALATAKADVWTELVREGKLGYMALLRNLRNMLQQAPDIVDEALEQLTDPERVHGSKVLPFRFLTAMQSVQGEKQAKKVVQALGRAADIATDNVPRLDGRTVVVIDTSGSMGGALSERSMASHRMVASLLGAVFAKRNDADIVLFADVATEFAYNPDDTTLTIANTAATGNPVGHGKPSRPRDQFWLVVRSHGPRVRPRHHPVRHAGLARSLHAREEFPPLLRAHRCIANRLLDRPRRLRNAAVPRAQGRRVGWIQRARVRPDGNDRTRARCALRRHRRDRALACRAGIRSNRLRRTSELLPIQPRK
jgi:hypothetical protein